MFQCTYFMFINLKGWGLCPNAEGGACVCVCGGGPCVLNFCPNWWGGYRRMYISFVFTISSMYI